MTALTIFGQLSLWGGFVGAAFVSVSHLEHPENPWQTIDWLPYVLFLILGSGGIVLLRMAQATHRNQASQSQVDVQSVVEQLVKCATTLDQSLAQRLDRLTCEEVLEIIDNQMAPLMAQFADQRQVLRSHLGTAIYAAVMTEFASGERYMNRAWSAAADGYVDEVVASVRHACAFLQAAASKAQQSAG